MKKYLYLLVLAFLPFVYSCSDDDDDKAYKTFSVEIGLAYPDGITPAAGVAVTLTHANATVYDAQTNAEGKATFTVPVGIYEAAVSDKRVQETMFGMVLVIGIVVDDAIVVVARLRRRPRRPASRRGLRRAGRGGRRH